MADSYARVRYQHSSSVKTPTPEEQKAIEEERLKKEKEAREAEERHQAELNRRIETLNTPLLMLQALADEKETVIGERTIIHQNLGKIYDNLLLPKLRELATTAASLTNTKDIQTEKSILKGKIDEQVGIKKTKISNTMKGVLDSYNEANDLAAKTKSIIQIIATNFGVPLEDIKDAEEPPLLPEDATDVVCRSFTHENTPKFVAGLVAIGQEQKLSHEFASLASSFSASATTTSVAPPIPIVLHENLPYQIVLKLLDVEAKAALTPSASSSVSISVSAPLSSSSSLASSSSIGSSSLPSSSVLSLFSASSSAVTTTALTTPQQDEFFTFITWLGRAGLVSKLGSHFPDVITAATSSSTVSPAFLDLFDKANSTDKRECLLVLVPAAQRSKVIQQYISSKATVSGRYTLEKLKPLLQSLAAFDASTFQDPFVLSSITDRNQYLQMIYEETSAENIASYLQFLPTNDRNEAFRALMVRCSLDDNAVRGAAHYELLKKAFTILKTAKHITITLPTDDSQVSSAMLKMISLHRGTDYADKCTDADLEQYEGKLLKFGSSDPVYYCMRDYKNDRADEKLRPIHIGELYSVVRPETADVKERPPLAFSVNIGKLGSSITGPQFVWDLYSTDSEKFLKLLNLNEAKTEQPYIFECMAQAVLGLADPPLRPLPDAKNLARWFLSSITKIHPASIASVTSRFGLWNRTGGLVDVLDNVASDGEFNALFDLVPQHSLRDPNRYKAELANDYAKHVVSSDANFRAFFVRLQKYDPTIAPKLDLPYQLKIIDGIADDNEFKTFFSNVKDKADLAQAYANQNAKDPTKLRAFIRRVSSCESEVKEDNQKTIPKLNLLYQLDGDNKEFAKVAAKIYEETKTEDMRLWLDATCRRPEDCAKLCCHVLLTNPKVKAKDDLFRQAMADSKQTLTVLSDSLLVGFPFTDNTQVSQLVTTILAENQDNQTAWLKSLSRNGSTPEKKAILLKLIKACYGDRNKYAQLRKSIIDAALVGYMPLLNQLDLDAFVTISGGFTKTTLVNTPDNPVEVTLLRYENGAFVAKTNDDKEMSANPIRCLMSKYRARTSPEDATQIAIRIMNAISEPASLEHKVEITSASSSIVVSASASNASSSSISVSSASAPSTSTHTSQELAAELLEEKPDITFILQAYDNNAAPFREAVNKDQKLAAEVFTTALAAFDRDLKPSPRTIVLDLVDNLSDTNRGYIATQVSRSNLNKVVPFTTSSQFSHLLLFVTEGTRAAFITANTEALVAKIRGCNSPQELHDWINAIPADNQAAVVQSAREVIIPKIRACSTNQELHDWLNAFPANRQAAVVQIASDILATKINGCSSAAALKDLLDAVPDASRAAIIQAATDVLVTKINGCAESKAMRGWIDAIPDANQTAIIQKVIEKDYFQPPPPQSASTVTPLLVLEQEEEKAPLKYVPQNYLHLRAALIDPECKNLPDLAAQAKFQELVAALYGNPHQNATVKFVSNPSALQGFAKLEYDAFKNTTNGVNQYTDLYQAQETRIEREQKLEQQRKEAEERAAQERRTELNNLQDFVVLTIAYANHKYGNERNHIITLLKDIISKQKTISKLREWQSLARDIPSIPDEITRRISTLEAEARISEEEKQRRIAEEEKKRQEEAEQLRQRTQAQKDNVANLSVPGLLTEYRKHNSRTNSLVAEDDIFKILKNKIQDSHDLVELGEWAALLPIVSASSSLALSSSAVSSSLSYAPDEAQTLILNQIQAVTDAIANEQKRVNRLTVPELLAEFRTPDSNRTYPQTLLTKRDILDQLRAKIQASHDLEELQRWKALLPVSASSSLSFSSSGSSTSLSSATDEAQTLILNRIQAVTDAIANEQKRVHELTVPALLTEFRTPDSNRTYPQTLLSKRDILDQLRAKIQASQNLDELRGWAALLPNVSASSSLALSSSAVSSSLSSAPDEAQTLITDQITKVTREVVAQQNTIDHLDFTDLLIEYRAEEGHRRYPLIKIVDIQNKLLDQIRSMNDLPTLEKWANHETHRNDEVQQALTPKTLARRRQIRSETEEKRQQELKQKAEADKRAQEEAAAVAAAELKKQLARDWSGKDGFALLLTILAFASLVTSVLLQIFFETSWLTDGLQIASALCVGFGALLTHLSKNEKRGEKGDYKAFCNYRPGFAASIIVFELLASLAAVGTALFLVFKENALPSGTNPIDAQKFAPMLGLAITGIYLLVIFIQTFSIFWNRKEPNLIEASSTALSLSTAYQLTQSASATTSLRATNDRPIQVIPIHTPRSSSLTSS